MQKSNVNSNLVGIFKFAKLDIFLKVKPDLGSIRKYQKLKLWHFCEAYLMVHDGNYEFDFCDRIPNKKNYKLNVACSNSWDTSGENFVKLIFMTITL